MSAVQDGNIAQRHIATILQADRLVAHAGRKDVVSRASAQAFAPDQPRPNDGYIVDRFAPEQAVVPVTVAEVLELVPVVGLGRVISAAAALGQ